jgi:hypothetical protein
MRVIVFGARDWRDVEPIAREMQKLPHGTIIIEGGAPGADTIAAEVARGLGFDVEEYVAEWGKYANAAGPIRNQRMLVEGRPEGGLAFHRDIEKSRGTRDMAMRLKKAGVPFRVFKG